MIACTMPLESMWIGDLIPGLSMQEPHRDVPPDKMPPPKHPPDVIPFDPDEEPDFPPGGPPIKDPPPELVRIIKRRRPSAFGQEPDVVA